MIGLRDKSPLSTNQYSKQQQPKYEQKQLKIRMNDISISNFSTPLLSMMMSQNIELSNILELNLSGNLLTSMPNLIDLKCLKNLNVAANKISSIKDMKLPNSLQDLNLSKNCITYLFERDTKGQAISFFKDLTNLSRLFLSENSIEQLHSCIFTSSARTLKQIDISQNKIKKGLICFSFLTHLEILNLSSNKLDDIQEFKKLDAKLPFLETIDISQTELDEKYGQKCEEYIKKFFSEKTKVLIGKNQKLQKKFNDVTCHPLNKKNSIFQSSTAIKKPCLNPNKIFKSLLKDEKKNEKNEKKQVELTSYSLERYNRQIQSAQNQSENNQNEEKHVNQNQTQSIKNKNQSKSTLTDHNQIKIEPSRHKRIQSAYSGNQTSYKLEEKNQQLTQLQDSQFYIKYQPNSSRHSSFTLPVVEEQPELNHVLENQKTKNSKILLNDFQNQIPFKQQTETTQNDNSNSMNTFQTPIRSHVRSPSAPLQDMKWKYLSQNSISSVNYNNYSIDTSPFELPLTQSSQKNKNSQIEHKNAGLHNSLQQEHQQQVNQNNLMCDFYQQLNSQLQMQVQSKEQIKNTNQMLNPDHEHLQNQLNQKFFIQNLCQILQTHVFKNDPSFSLEKLEDAFNNGQKQFLTQLKQYLIKLECIKFQDQINPYDFNIFNNC
ncbi:hypothetical protein TTHERM_00571810 (macronuclear) [Tetrahymena thermophila SB210]|uniref:Leucine rich repeat protein n=1 Tax=Tetrahymena thermophila (strain SB210) TaxID=312017 RepID=Q24HZ3_TETTS|nr:hypothetical protein TTHERM_00571810 [Tetrahymena thermophila SB210]EAS07445.2 hypothetical protein TTHERM_00571810 [Tetrahymena thermophila SB210]|eukprot:XP_001027687.2 hypothetical protein TTHERM_00571810 [Tetrahymena thermophila SB210]